MGYGLAVVVGLGVGLWVGLGVGLGMLWVGLSVGLGVELGVGLRVVCGVSEFPSPVELPGLLGQAISLKMPEPQKRHCACTPSAQQPSIPFSQVSSQKCAKPTGSPRCGQTHSS